MNRYSNQRGQVLVLTALTMMVLLGMAALVLDVGHWFRAQRDLQATADASALAGAQALPEDAGTAAALAAEYTSKNGGSGATATVTFTSKNYANDTIHVKLSRETPGFFAKIFGIDSVEVGAKSAARSINPSNAKWAAPFGVDEKHPLLHCSPGPCFDEATELDLDKVGPGAFRIINLDGSKGGTGSQTLGEWILSGYAGYMPLGEYKSDPGAKFNSSEVQAAIREKIASGEELLFPVYRTIREEGANLEYEVIGWVGFVITDAEIHGSKGKLFGHFTRVIWEGFTSSSAAGNPDFGVRSIELID